MKRLSRLKSLTVLLAVLSLAANTCVCGAPCPRCSTGELPNPGTVTPEDAVFCVGDSVDWATTVCTNDNPQRACFWSLSGAFDHDFCGDPGQIFDNWCADFTITGPGALSNGRVEFIAPGVGNVQASMYDLGDPGCGDPGGSRTSAPADYYVIGGPVTSDKDSLMYRCVPGNPDIAIVTATTGQPSGTQYNWSVAGPATLHTTVNPAVVAIWADVEPVVHECAATVTLTYTLGAATCTANTQIDIRRPLAHNSFQGVQYTDGTATFTSIGLTPPPPCQPSDTIWGFCGLNMFPVFDQCGRPFVRASLSESIRAVCGAYAGPTGGSTGDDGVATDCIGVLTCDSTILCETYSCSLEQRWSLMQCELLHNCVQLSTAPFPGHELDDPMIGGVSYSATVNVAPWPGNDEGCPCP